MSNIKSTQDSSHNAVARSSSVSFAASEESFTGITHDKDEQSDTPADKLTKMLTGPARDTASQISATVSEMAPDVVSKVESFADALSRHTTRSGAFNMDSDSDDGFDAHAIFESFVRDADEQGIHIRKAGVTIENVSAKGVDASALEGATFGNILCLPLTIFKGIKAKRHQKMRQIISNVNALAEAGEMILVLGRPGAGCSSFLKVTAGEIDQFAGGVFGEVAYDGIPQEEMMKRYKADVIYNGELDVHFPYLTVKQTLDFAIACKTPALRVNNVSKKEYIASRRDLYATIFGLRHTYNTRVGNDFVRGVSGGERKRVSIAEALAAKGSIYCWDNATRGLDASTALEYAKAIRIMTNLLKSTAFVTIYQASENIYETFDKVTVLYSGKQIYFGLIHEAKPYFAKMGYLCPPRQATAEFLTALTDPNGFHLIKPGYENKVPRTAEEFETYWLNSPEFAQMKNDIAAYKEKVNTEKTKEVYDESMAQEKSKYTRKKSYYTVSYWEQVKLCTQRGFQRIYGNKSYTVINVCSAIIQSFITGSLFYNTPSSTSGAFSRGGVLYFALLYYSLMGLANISFEHRPILQKHKGYSLYHPSAEAIGSTLASFPFRMIGLTCFFIILFFLSGLHRTAGSFFTIYLFLTMCSEAINGLFEMVSSVCDTLSQANSISGILMMSISMYSTYMIQLPSMHPWFKWISYVLPIRYAFESMLNAEFHGRHMDCANTLVPSGGDYDNLSDDYKVCAFVGSKPGQSYVLGDDYLKNQFQYFYKHTWRNFGILWCFLLGYIVLKVIFTEYKRPVKGGGDALIFKKGSKRFIAHADEESPDNVNDIDAKEQFSSESSGANDEVFDDLEAKGVFIWKDVCFTIPYEGGKRMLLDNVSGYCIPGTMTALMGESGAGKTTLLNTLAQRNVGIITGDMLVNGRPIDASFERRTGYVQQQDIHIAELTVRESLQFSARMRRPQHLPDSEKMDYVEKIIRVLGMEEYAEALVGEVGCGLNVEQRKKLSIGVELVAKPDLLLFLDEPTSGLDSQSSWAIIQLLRKLSKAGQSILCTIHQPSATLFEEFDRLLLLRKGGQTVYFGDIGKNSATILNYFERNGARKCDSSENPAEYILEAIGAGATASVKEDWHEKWMNSVEFEQTKEKVQDLINDLSKQETKSEVGDKPSKYATSYAYQFRYVLIRTSTSFWRSLNYIMSKMMLMLVGGLYIGFTFFNVGKSYVGLQNAMFAAFISIILSAPAMNQIQGRAIASRELFEVRESQSNMFHWSLVLITQYLSELPYHLFFSTIFFVSSYFPLRIFFEASRSAVYFLNYCIMFQLYYVGLGLMILYMSPNLPSANVILGLCLSFMLSFCGVTQPVSLMPGFWTFMWKASPYTYFVQNMVGIMLHKKPVVCKKKELNYFNPPNGSTCGEYMKPFLEKATGYIENPDATSDCAYCIYEVGDNYLTHISSKYSYLWRNFGIFWIYIFFNIIAMVCVYYVFHVRQSSFLSPVSILNKIKNIRKKKQ
ncbi:XXYS1_4_G0045650.mRNA.1.CDS.1 [Saccharomyces cerevisiae]|nr:XXYS1_4_G0045650.mRNA.1.CDS.1 [Saccharomyces cerevisiae]CAD6609618.1 EM14S01-3B_G0043160.mRNA.1.CDS.1 [Saccharomyces cerevisiae]CAI4330815.1 AMH_1a_G0008820.mRNA.1.CDS.1 [Saccharomyces cerevisiae]CAI4337357.1 CEI_1a_G0008700.mRNA.1.CDS.1 [Saccharomyces cerevisiae]CAI6547999.1 AMH_1a_G0008820.mRNA.1.CDS.1 [Saccharomyces cerevisiae]